MKQRPQGVLLTGLLPKACSACFLGQPRTPCPRLAPSTVRLSLPRQSLIKEILPHSCPSANVTVILSCAFPSQITLASVRLTNTSQHTSTELTMMLYIFADAWQCRCAQLAAFFVWYMYKNSDHFGKRCAIVFFRSLIVGQLSGDTGNNGR